jgi:hypothetical protein
MERLTKRQRDVAVALLETPESWVEFDRGEWRYVKPLYDAGFCWMDRPCHVREKPTSLTFETKLRPEKTEELRRLVEGLAPTPVTVFYEVRYLSPMGGAIVREPLVDDKDYVFKRRDILNQDPVTAIPNSVEIIEVSRKRIA